MMDKKTKERLEKMGEVILKRPKSESCSGSFNLGLPISIPEYEKLIFMSEEKEKQWNELDSAVKDHVLSNLRHHSMGLSTQVTIDLLCHTINELHARLKKLEGKENG